ncbi:hypothetical protein C9I57_04830 [Trinickia symbiotica]|uniref:DUF2968 domain-containing protein n=1 Tax=Trinickia symbiotica TaxID=863227 RepID=A0A2T3XZQ0_9BURK|nr:DUF2968 domain-containing protein [Trinickia symbiotica]PTB21952.1 hypothetical protein C9I57_04830 [Trinickia symbiotica]
MRNFSRMRGTALAALVVIGGIGMVGCAGAQSAGEVASATPSMSAPVAASAAVVAAAPAPVVALSASTTIAPDQSASATTSDDTKEAQGNVAELRRLMRSNELTELRTSYNGSYGASLLLHGDDLTYYIALFQQKNFWRVIKTHDDARAEQIYADFVKKSAQLADVELRRAKLAAQKAYTERQIALQQARADRLQADLDVAHQQQTLFASRQKETREEAAALEMQKRAAQDQLRDLRRQVQSLQRENEQGLPHSIH